MTIGERLKMHRTRNDLTMQGIAADLGVDYTTYSRYEHDKSEIKLEHAAKFAQLCNISIDELYFEKDTSELALEIVKEASAKYEKKKKRTIQVMVELDGLQNTLDYWMDKLGKVNRMIVE